MENDKIGILEKFKASKVGLVLSIPIALLIPSQPDDQKTTRSTGPIQAYSEGDLIVVLDGNHRLNEIKRRGTGKRKLQVRKVENPHEDHIKA